MNIQIFDLYFGIFFFEVGHSIHGLSHFVSSFFRMNFCAGLSEIRDLHFFRHLLKNAKTFG